MTKCMKFVALQSVNVMKFVKIANRCKRANKNINNKKFWIHEIRFAAISNIYEILYNANHQQVRAARP